LRRGTTLAAAQLTRGLREMGAAQNIPFDAVTLHVADTNAPRLERLMVWSSLGAVLLRQEGRTILKLTAPILRRWQIRFDKILRNFVEKHPGHLPEALLCVGKLR